MLPPRRTARGELRAPDADAVGIEAVKAFVIQALENGMITEEGVFYDTALLR